MNPRRPRDRGSANQCEHMHIPAAEPTRADSGFTDISSAETTLSTDYCEV